MNIKELLAVLGGPACIKNIINHMVASMALGSDAALATAPDQESIRDELLAVDLSYLARCIDVWEKHGVPLPIVIKPEILSAIRAAGLA